MKLQGLRVQGVGGFGVVGLGCRDLSGMPLNSKP